MRAHAERRRTARRCRSEAAGRVWPLQDRRSPPDLFAEVDVESRHWLAERFREAGLDTVIDGIGNVIGRNRRAGPRLLVGSHSETQPYGGWLDGSLGVIYGLELARAFAAEPRSAEFGVDVVAWADEEGHYGNFLGSRSFTDALPEEEIDQTRGRDNGMPLREALERAGFAGRPRETVDPSRYVGYFEAHIEQGDTLDAAGLRIGVVETIVGIWNYRVTLLGEQNHAGTTRMVGAAMREWGWCGSRPAFMTGFPKSPARARCGPSGACCWSRMPRRWFPDVPKCRSSFATPISTGWRFWTRHCTNLSAKPTGPGHAPARSRPLREPSRGRWIAGSKSKSRLLRNAMRPDCTCGMPSAAGHDAAVLSYRMPSGMMFIPSLRGISHHWSEDTKEEDIVLGAQVFADAAENILRSAR